MSSAFDTLDHNVLINRLSAIGITGIAINWFTSYITNRSSSVRINTHSSPSRSITHGVPQGSVLGPLLFNIYLLPMFDIFTDYPDISFHTYADDLQLYINCTDFPTHMHKSIHYHLHCIRLILRSILLPIAITIASSYIIPLFDYCNSLLYNLPEYKLFKLHRLQNAVVRCVHLLPRRSSDSITPILKQLHWPPVPYRIKYKLSLTINKAIHHNSPTYNASLLHLHTVCQ